MEYAQNLNGSASYTVRDDVGGPRNHQFTGTRHAAGASHLRIVRKQTFDIMENVQHDPSRPGGTFLCNIGS